jgi:hypothetical protein
MYLTKGKNCRNKQKISVAHILIHLIQQRPKDIIIMVIALAEVDRAHNDGNTVIQQAMHVERCSIFCLDFREKYFYFLNNSRLQTSFSEAEFPQSV